MESCEEQGCAVSCLNGQQLGLDRRTSKTLTLAAKPLLHSGQATTGTNANAGATAHRVGILYNADLLLGMLRDFGATALVISYVQAVKDRRFVVTDHKPYSQFFAERDLSGDPRIRTGVGVKSATVMTLSGCEVFKVADKVSMSNICLVSFIHHTARSCT
jgi:hypothetical protein